jgi:hypothetical protein
LQSEISDQYKKHQSILIKPYPSVHKPMRKQVDHDESRISSCDSEDMKPSMAIQPQL